MELMDSLLDMTNSYLPFATFCGVATGTVAVLVGGWDGKRTELVLRRLKKKHGVETPHRPGVLNEWLSGKYAIAETHATYENLTKLVTQHGRRLFQSDYMFDRGYNEQFEQEGLYQALFNLINEEQKHHPGSAGEDFQNHVRLCLNKIAEAYKRYNKEKGEADSYPMGDVAKMLTDYLAHTRFTITHWNTTRQELGNGTYKALLKGELN